MTSAACRSSTPESTSAFLRAEIGKWEPIIRAAGIKVE